MSAPIFVLPRNLAPLYTTVVVVYHLLTIAISLSPFWYVARKYKPAKWRHVAVATAVSFVAFSAFYWLIGDAVTRLVGRLNIGNGNLVAVPFDEYLLLSFFVLVPLALSLSAFVSVWLVYRKYSWRRVLLACCLAAGLIAAWVTEFVAILYLGGGVQPQL
ncbi:MAG: hypothetical protein PHT12_01340 [Patescibacteria group bacterium]|nr:hypothetical protein [Patescibacteria group bacterium]